MIEYIEVVHLRGGVSKQVKTKEDVQRYTSWQTLQARAGKAMVKFNKPKEKAIPTFDDADLDL